MGQSILILNWRSPHDPKAGGAERMTLQHAKAWIRKGYAVTWLAGGYHNSNPQEIIEGITVHTIGNAYTIYLLAPWWYWMHCGKFTIVVDEIHGIPFLTPLWAWRSKKLVYIHEVAQEIWNDMVPFPLNILGRLYEKIYFVLYKNVTFMTVSNSTKNDLVRYGINIQKIHVIPNALNVPVLTYVPTKEKRFTLIFVSRLVRMKGIEDALHIFRQVLLAVPHAQLWIVGYGEEQYVSMLKRKTHQLHIVGNTTFWGFVSEKKKLQLMQRAHFLLHTSRREGFGLVVIEANTQGTPAIVYDVPGLRDVVLPNINGIIMTKDDTHTIVQTITDMKNTNQYKNLIRSSIHYAKQFSARRFTKESCALIKGL